MTNLQGTVGSALTAAAERLTKAKVEDPYREAVILMSRRLNCPPAMVYVRREEPLGEYLNAGFQIDVQRREKREPTALIAGEKGFFGRMFLVTRDTLVPRPETEMLVESALAAMPAKARVLDIGTGTGCVGLTIAAERPGCKVLLTDISEAALGVARKNAEKLELSRRIDFRLSDLYRDLGPEFHGDFDIILSNPPYVKTQVIPTLEPELKFEPRNALDGGMDGLSVIRPLIAGAGTHLRPGGKLLMEIGFDQGSAVKELLTAAGFKDVGIAKDFAGHDRIASGVK